jgi:hypothetical protein
MSDLRDAAARLRKPVPMVYSILHQAWPDLEEEAYTRNILALHRRIRQETLRFSEALLEAEGGDARGADSFRPQADPRRLPPLDSRQYRFLFPELGGPSLRRHLPDGTKYLQHLGFAPEQRGTLQETEFLLSGSPVLDFLEIVVRDLIGIGGGVHGAQIRALSAVCFMLRNQILEVGARRPGPCHWAVLYFEKPGAPGTISYDIFRSALRTILEDHLERGSFPYTVLYQRKLGLGRGTEFSLRIQLPLGPDPALDLFLHDLFHEEGALEALRFGLAVQEEISVESPASSARSGDPPPV